MGESDKETEMEPLISTHPMLLQEGILTNILDNLDPITLFRIKTVCKQWNQIIVRLDTFKRYICIVTARTTDVKHVMLQYLLRDSHDIIPYEIYKEMYSKRKTLAQENYIYIPNPQYLAITKEIDGTVYTVDKEYFHLKTKVNYHDLYYRLLKKVHKGNTCFIECDDMSCKHCAIQYRGNHKKPEKEKGMLARFDEYVDKCVEDEWKKISRPGKRDRKELAIFIAYAIITTLVTLVGYNKFGALLYMIYVLYHFIKSKP
jgi:hypothetical protein